MLFYVMFIAETHMDTLLYISLLVFVTAHIKSSCIEYMRYLRMA